MRSREFHRSKPTRIESIRFAIASSIESKKKTCGFPHVFFYCSYICVLLVEGLQDEQSRGADGKNDKQK